MGIANFPFPSFTLILTSDRVVIPGPSYVIRLAPLPHVPQTIPFDQSKPKQPKVEEYYPLMDLTFENDSATDVTVGHPYLEEFPYDIMTPTQTVETTRSGQGHKLSVLKIRRPTALFRLKNIFKRLLNADA